MTDQDSVGDGKEVQGSRRTWRVWVVIALWCGLALQGAADIVIRQSGHNAFPTIAMPGFGAKNIGTDGRAKVTARTIDVIGADGTQHAVAPEELLAPMPVASAISTLDEIFEPSAEGAPELSADTVNYLKRQTELLDSPSEAVGLRLVWQPELFDIQSLERVPSGTATVREVKW